MMDDAPLESPIEDYYRGTIKVFSHSPRTLQELASIKSAFCIRSKAALNAFPRTIRKMIESKFIPIEEELEFLWDNLKCEGHYVKEKEIRARRHLVAFGGNGTIHFKATVANFLADETLGPLVRFEMACVYCMEDKVNALWPKVQYLFAFHHLTDSKTNSQIDSIMYYWIYKKKSESNHVGVDVARKRAEILMDRRSFVWLSVEYFLGLLDDAKRERKRFKLFRRYDFPKIFVLSKYLLPYFDAPLQRGILFFHRAKIVRELVEDYSMAEYGIQAWMYVRNHVTAHQYYDILIRRYLIKVRSKLGEDGNDFALAHAEIVLGELWSNAPLELREDMAMRYTSDILTQMANCRGAVVNCESRDISFVVGLLSGCDDQFRDAYWRENWCKWFVGLGLSQFDELTGLCLGDANAVEEFAPTVKESDTFREHLYDLVSRGYHRELNEVFSAMYADRPDLATDLLDGVILSERISSVLRDKVEKNEFALVKNIAELCSSAEKKLELRRGILDAFRARIIRGELHAFDASDWSDFLSWCLSDVEQPDKVDNFLKSLPFCDIFHRSVTTSMEFERDVSQGHQYRAECTSEDLRKFLIWIFKTVGRSNEVVHERFRYYNKLHNTVGVDIFCVRRRLLMSWFMEKLISCSYQERAYDVFKRIR